MKNIRVSSVFTTLSHETQAQNQRHVQDLFSASITNLFYFMLQGENVCVIHQILYFLIWV
ncbi:hypothetical protein EXN66_Car018952 [Channa argus]|uniref:Uncharacterized protein n=1 Tax=Channa argus TaxID=215402 RepID=A0A6G1QLB8_CHAAH|nr:hypothetical protein EXN66_Car018952 [Channa argus]